MSMSIRSLSSATDGVTEPVAAACAFCSFRNSRNRATPVPENTQKTSRWCSLNSGGASRQNARSSSRRNAWTPVKLKWVNFGQLLRRI